MAAAVYEQDSSFYQAMQLGILETVGLGWKVKQDYLREIQQISGKQVQAVAKKYLTAEQLTVALLDPLPIEGRVVKKSTGAMRHGR